ncbi:MAG: hypothetical protein ACFFAH_17835 [Promethearchaeota archaeon]
MPKNSLNLDEFEEDESKIYFEEEISACFACGEKIDIETEVCPYCKTKQNKKVIVPKEQ